MYLFAEVGQENLIASLLDFRSNFINWVLLLAVLFFLIKKFVPPLIQQRQQSINNELAAAAKTRHDAERALAEQKEQIAKASQAAEKIVAEAKQVAKQMTEEVKKQTEQEASELLKKFETAAHNERQVAVMEMRKIVAKVAIKLAEENLQSGLTADNKLKLGQEFMGELSKLNQSALNEPLKKNNTSDSDNKMTVKGNDGSFVDKRDALEKNLMDSE